MGKIANQEFSKATKAANDDGKMPLTAFKKPRSLRACEQKKRDCLMCRETFVSTWFGERICSRCKKSAAWRNALSES